MGVGDRDGGGGWRGVAADVERAREALKSQTKNLLSACRSRVEANPTTGSIADKPFTKVAAHATPPVKSGRQTFTQHTALISITLVGSRCVTDMLARGAANM